MGNNLKTIRANSGKTQWRMNSAFRSLLIEHMNKERDDLQTSF